MVGNSIFLRWNSANGLIACGTENLLPTPSPFSLSFFRLSCGAWVPTPLLTVIPRRKNTMHPQTHGHDGPQPSFNANPLSGRFGESRAYGTSWLHDCREAPCGAHGPSWCHV